MISSFDRVLVTAFAQGTGPACITKVMRHVHVIFCGSERLCEQLTNEVHRLVMSSCLQCFFRTQVQHQCVSPCLATLKCRCSAVCGRASQNLWCLQHKPVTSTCAPDKCPAPSPRQQHVADTDKQLIHCKLIMRPSGMLPACRIMFVWPDSQQAWRRPGLLLPSLHDDYHYE